MTDEPRPPHHRNYDWTYYLLLKVGGVYVLRPPSPVEADGSRGESFCLADVIVLRREEGRIHAALDTLSSVTAVASLQLFLMDQVRCVCVCVCVLPGLRRAVSSCFPVALISNWIRVVVVSNRFERVRFHFASVPGAPGGGVFSRLRLFVRAVKQISLLPSRCVELAPPPLSYHKLLPLIPDDHL